MTPRTPSWRPTYGGWGGYGSFEERAALRTWLYVLTPTTAGIGVITVFLDAALFVAFGLPSEQI
jgi:hypothetical protein